MQIEQQAPAVTQIALRLPASVKKTSEARADYRYRQWYRLSYATTMQPAGRFAWGGCQMDVRYHGSHQSASLSVDKHDRVACVCRKLAPAPPRPPRLGGAAGVVG